MARITRKLSNGYRTSRELIGNLWDGPYWWLVAVVAILLPAAIVFVVLQATPVVAPFVYTLF